MVAGVTSFPSVRVHAIAQATLPDSRSPHERIGRGFIEREDGNADTMKIVDAAGRRMFFRANLSTETLIHTDT